MAISQIRMSIMLSVIIMGCILMMDSASGFIHIVGGSYGWRVPPNKTYYEDWAKPRTFGIGDRLVFPSIPSANNVVQVNKEDFDACTFRSVINMYFAGPIIVNLTKIGDFYYYNGHGKHCEFGQKLHIKVGDKPGSSGNLYPFKLIPKDVADAPAATSQQPQPSTQNVKSSSSHASIFPNSRKVFR